MYPLIFHKIYFKIPLHICTISQIFFMCNSLVTNGTEFYIYKLLVIFIIYYGYFESYNSIIMFLLFLITAIQKRRGNFRVMNTHIFYIYATFKSSFRQEPLYNPCNFLQEVLVYQDRKDSVPNIVHNVYSLLFFSSLPEPLL